MAPRKVRHYWALVPTLLLILFLALTACERQLQDQGNEVVPETGTVEEQEQPAEAEETGEEAAAPAEETAGEAEEEGDEDRPVEGIPSDDPESAVTEGEPAATEESPRPADEVAGEESVEGEEVAAEEGEAESEEAEEAAETGEEAAEETAEGAAEGTAAEGEEEATETQEATEAEADETTGEAEAATEVATAEDEVIHVVQVGENLYRIGLQYGISWVALAAYNNLPNANAIYVGQELKIPADASAPGATPTPTPQPPAETTYVVQAGDSLYRIGQLYNISWVLIAEANGLVNPNQIYVGQTLKIPGSAPAPAPQLTHTVQPNETLFLISLHYGVPWMTIASANNLNAPYVIYPGQTLVIPAGG